MEAEVVPEVTHVAGHGFDPARKDKLAIRVPATDALVAFGALTSKSNPDMKTIDKGVSNKMDHGPRLLCSWVCVHGSLGPTY